VRIFCTPCPVRKRNLKNRISKAFTRKLFATGPGAADMERIGASGPKRSTKCRNPWKESGGRKEFGNSRPGIHVNSPTQLAEIFSSTN